MKATQERRVDRFVMGLCAFALLIAIGLMVFV